jgi:hypothetical protein
MNGPYVNEDGDVWIERGSAPWPRIQREARYMLDELGCGPSDGFVIEYLGIETGVNVSDEHEYPHHDPPDGCRDSLDLEDGEEPPPGWQPCCRVIEAHHFRGDER